MAQSAGCALDWRADMHVRGREARVGGAVRPRKSDSSVGSWPSVIHGNVWLTPHLTWG